MFRYRYVVILLTLLIGGIFSASSSKLPGRLDGDGFKTKGEYEVTERILEKEFKQSRNTVVFYVEKKKGATIQQFDEDLKRLVSDVEKMPNKEMFMHPFLNPEMKKENSGYITILMEGQNEEEQVSRSLEITKDIEEMPYQFLSVKGFGYNIINDELNKQTQKDLQKAEMIGVPIAFLVLLLSFGTLRGALLPIINGALSVATTLGILYFLVDYVPLSIYVLNVTPMVGLALSIDFALLFVNRFKEEVVRHSVKEAIELTFETAGRAILFSALCVFVGLSGLFFFQIEFIQSVAISGMIVVFVSLFFSLTLLPASLALIGKKIIKKGKKKLYKSHRKNHWKTFGEFVMRKPVVMTTLVFIFIGVSLIPLKDAELGFPSIEVLPADSPTRVAFEKYETVFSPEKGDYATVKVVIESSKPVKEQYTEIYKLVQKLEKKQEIKEVNSVFSTLKMDSTQLSNPLPQEIIQQVKQVEAAYVNDNNMFIEIVLKDSPKAWDAKVWVRDAKALLTELDDSFAYYVGGETKFEQELEMEVINKALPALSVILGSTFLILMIAFRSILIPLKAIVMNVLSLSATIGIIVWLFNGGHFGLESSMVLFTLPVFIFGLVFGLSMDYEVFLISRIYELYGETKDNDTATLEGLVSTSKIITSAALIMIVVTGAFAFTEILPVKQMGLGIALAIFVDATIIRLILVPSLMKLLGDWNWWFPGNKKSSVKNAL